MLVSDRDTRFTSAFWTVLHAALGASLIFGSPHHHNTTTKVERVNGVIADVLLSFAGERADDWPTLVPRVEFAINDSASPLGTGYTPFYADILLDAASYGSRWVLLLPAPVADVARALRPRAPRP